MYIPNEIIKSLQVDVTDTRKDVSEIKNALLGNEYNPDGLIKRQCNTEERLTKAEGRIDKIFWTAAGISGGVSGLIGIVALILKFVIK